MSDEFANSGKEIFKEMRNVIRKLNLYTFWEKTLLVSSTRGQDVRIWIIFLTDDKEITLSKTF